ncbi:MAG: fibrobacter succinogenes major paralogous domain-containing protein [Prevotellaceae bacterium]|jgi:uncharacterized protein (TIGR02145 family)|nr:fibrobacter succinogenes major paralogous domain-containing protein [Prevotellaceae bacterium]
MKKLFSLITALLFLVPLFGQGARVVETRSISVDYNATPPTVTFEVYWNTAPTPPRHRDTVWVFVDYALITGNTVGPWAPASITNVQIVGAGTITYQTERGFYLDGHGPVPFSSTVTITLSSDLNGKKFNWCAYATDYPPNATATPGAGHYDLHGTPPFIVNNTNTVQTREYTGCIDALTDATGCPGLIPEKPSISNFSPSTPTLCAGEEVTLTATATGAASYSFHNGTDWSAWTTSTDTTFIPTATQTYKLRVINDGGCVVEATITPTITVHPLPEINSFTPSPDTICYGQSSVLTVSATGATSYSFVNPPVWDTDNTYTVSPKADTICTVYAKTDKGCIDSAKVTVTVNPLPVITSFTASPDAICFGQSTELTVSATGATSYSFVNPPVWGTDNTYTVSPKADTICTVYAKTDKGCIDSAKVTITVNPLPVINSFTPSPAAICFGDSTTLTVTGNVTSYSFGDQNSWDGLTTKTISPKEDTTYFVYAKTGEGCIDSKPVSITVYDLPVPAFTLAPTVACSADSVTLEASGGGEYCFTVVCNTCIRNPYEAGNDEPSAVDCKVLDTECTYSTNNTFTFKMPESGDVTVWVKVKNSNGCIDSISRTIHAIDCNKNHTGCATSSLDLGTQSFKTNTEHTLNGIVMSASVLMSYCNKSTYNGTDVNGQYQADCRDNNDPTGQVFSWCMVQQYASVLCPNGWRVPTKEDFCKMANGSTSNCGSGSLGNTSWWEFGQYADVDGTLTPTPRDEFGEYWSISDYDLWTAYAADVREDEAALHPAVTADKRLGFALRCVKDVAP